VADGVLVRRKLGVPSNSHALVRPSATCSARCRGELEREEVERLASLARPQSDVRRSSDESPRLLGMTANRDELIHLIEGMPDDQVDVLLADAKRLAGSKARGTWPPKFVGMITDGPTNGSSPEYIDTVMSRGFGSER